MILNLSNSTQLSSGSKLVGAGMGLSSILFCLVQICCELLHFKSFSPFHPMSIFVYLSFPSLALFQSDPFFTLVLWVQYWTRANLLKSHHRKLFSMAAISRNYEFRMLFIKWAQVLKAESVSSFKLLSFKCLCSFNNTDNVLHLSWPMHPSSSQLWYICSFKFSGASNISIQYSR